MKEIQLTQGKVALIDDEDWELVSQYKWQARAPRPRTGNYSWYAQANYRKPSGKPSIITMHGLVMKTPPGMQVDHRDGDGLNNRRSNMRVCTNAENHQNIRRSVKQTSSVFKGVSWHKQSGKWRARIGVSGRHMTIGSFTDEREAALAYNARALKEFGDFAYLNDVDMVCDPTGQFMLVVG